MDSPGTRKGPYRLVRSLGRGESGTVWLARDAGRREVAVKVSTAVDDPRHRRLRVGELTALGKLRHPLAPKLLWVGDDAHAMELVKGVPLDRALSAPVELQRLLPLLLDLLDVLAHAHGLGIVHRDLKPANLLVTNTPAIPVGTVERLHVVDFGLADVRSLDALGSRDLKGTWDYMSREARAARRVDSSEDLHAVGKIACELLGETVAPFAALLGSGAERRRLHAEDVIERIVRRHGGDGSALARPPANRDAKEALRVSLGTARVPDALARRAPAKRLAAFLRKERDAGRLHRAGRTWVYDAPLSDGDSLRRDGRAREAIAAYVREGNYAEAADLHQRQQEYDQAIELLLRAEQGPRPLEARITRGLTLREVGRLEESVEILASVRRGSSGAIRARAAAEEGHALELLHRRDEATERFDEALRLARVTRDPDLEAKALTRLGDQALRLGDAKQAEALLTEALAKVRAAGEHDATPAILNNLGYARELQLRLDEAASNYEDALAGYGALEDRRGSFTVLVNMGNLSVRRLELGRARRFYESALQVGEPETTGRQAIVLVNLGYVLTLGGAYDEARAYGDAAVRALESSSQQALLAHALRNRGDAIRRGAADSEAAIERALADFRRAREVAESNGLVEILAEVELDLAEVEAIRGLLLQAGTRAEEARKVATKHGNAEHEIRAHAVLARIFNLASLFEEAERHARQAEASAVGAGTALHRVEALRELAIALEGLGRVRDAAAAHERANEGAAVLADAADIDGQPVDN